VGEPGADEPQASRRPRRKAGPGVQTPGGGRKAAAPLPRRKAGQPGNAAGRTSNIYSRVQTRRRCTAASSFAPANETLSPRRFPSGGPPAPATWLRGSDAGGVKSFRLNSTLSRTAVEPERFHAARDEQGPVAACVFPPTDSACASPYGRSVERASLLFAGAPLFIFGGWRSDGGSTSERTPLRRPPKMTLSRHGRDYA